MYTNYDDYKLSTPEGNDGTSFTVRPKNVMKSPSFIRTKHMIDQADGVTYATCIRYVTLYLDLEYEPEMDKIEIKLLAKIKFNQLFNS